LINRAWLRLALTAAIAALVGGRAASAEKGPVDLQQCVANLGSSDFTVRQLATQHLQEAGVGAIPLLAEAMSSGDREVRSRSLQILLSHALSLQYERRDRAMAALRTLANGDDSRLAEVAQGTLDKVRDVAASLATSELGRLGATVMPVENSDPPQYNVQIRQTWAGGDERLALLQDLGIVPWLSLENAPVGDAALAHVARLRSLDKLYLGSSLLTGRNLPELAPLSRLQYLSLKQLPIDDAKLRALPRFNDLRYLGLDGTQITDEGLKELARFPLLQTLWLDQTNITDAGLVHLKPLSNLRSLFIPGTRTAGPGLAELKHLPSLTYLSLKGTKQTTESLKQLGTLTQLETLGLDNTNITDEQIRHLAGLTKLRILWLSNTDITDQAIEPLSKLTDLQVLYLTATQVSADGSDQLRRALPKCHIAR